MRTLSCWLLLSCIVFVSSQSVMAQDEAPNPITEHHALLKKDVGNWAAEMKMFMPGADEPQVSKGVETNRLFGKGLWLISNFKGEFGGMEFQGRGQFGYDPVKKKYVQTWIDSMSPGVSTSEGTYDAKTKTLTMMGSTVGADGAKYKTKSVIVYGKGTRTFTMSMGAPDSDELMKAMEITYTKQPRSKKAKKEKVEK